MFLWKKKKKRNWFRSKLDFAVQFQMLPKNKNLWLSFECSVFGGNKKYNHSYVQCSRRVISIINCPSLLIFVLCFYDNDCSFFFRCCSWREWCFFDVCVCVFFKDDDKRIKEQNSEWNSFFLLWLQNRVKKTNNTIL